MRANVLLSHSRQTIGKDPIPQGPTRSSPGAMGLNNAWNLKLSKPPVRQTAVKGECKVDAAEGHLEPTFLILKHSSSFFP